MSYVGTICESRLDKLLIEDDYGTRRDAADFARSLAAVGLLPSYGSLRPVAPGLGLAQYRWVPTRPGSFRHRGYGVKTPSGDQREHAGPRPEGMGVSQAKLRDRLGDELRACALSPKAVPPAHT